MKRHLLFLALSTPIITLAQLAPSSPVPLAEHMLEVNKEWRNYDGVLATEPIHFNTDTERIARHLQLVVSTLSSKEHAAMGPEQVSERRDLLEVLERYADAGRFPQNHVLPYRNPIFIDPYGTACAVGHLMIESGHRELAERIDEAMETAYLADIIADPRFSGPVGEWAGAHGFSADELAWIQPGYPPSVPWYPVGGGTNAAVDVVLPISNGDLLVVGSFTEAGSVPCQGAARWNGDAYTALGEIPEGVINCAIEHNGELYVGGSFNNGLTDLLRWSQGAWVGEAVFASKWAEVTALLSHEGSLYAAGAASGFAGFDYGVKVLQDGDWLPLPGTLNGPIHALEFHEGYLVAGGAFTGNFLSTQDDILHVARYLNSGWSQIADGLNGTVHDLLVHENALYATGDMVSMIGTSFGLASIENDLGEWTQLMPNIQDYIGPSPVDAPSVGRRMVAYDDRIFIAGELTAFTGLTWGSGVIAYNGAPDEVEPYCNFFGPARDIALFNGNRLVVGGNSEFLDNLIWTDLSTGMRNVDEMDALNIYPNPAAEIVRIALDAPEQAASVRLFDASGKQVFTDVRTGSGPIELDVSKLAVGSYSVEVNDGQRSSTGRFVKQ